MIDLTSTYAVAIVIALLIGLIVGWWVFKRGRSGAVDTARGASSATIREQQAGEGGEGNGLADQDAAAVADIAGELLGVDVHAELPGASGPPDDLQMMKGVGAKLAAKLNENGIIRFDQLAALSPAQVLALDARMDQFKGRVARDRLVEQAAYLARGDRDGFQATFGNLGGATTIRG
jgi:predicted flap endonuclease-1-like 5' DNA nuclease